MVDDPAPAHLEETALATSRYLAALTDLDEAAVRAPSLLPGWSRAHVIAHVSRNADALVNLLSWARTGAPTPMYPSQESRDADIEAGATRALEELRRDAADSAARFAEAAARLEPHHWDTLVGRTPGSPLSPARRTPLRRRIEVEVHHADLDLGYTSNDWPSGFAEVVVGTVQDDRAEGPSLVLSATDGDGLWKLGAGQGPEVSGATAELAWWVLGRGDGAGLTCSTGELPRLGKWR